MKTDPNIEQLTPADQALISRLARFQPAQPGPNVRQRIAASLLAGPAGWRRHRAPALVAAAAILAVALTLLLVNRPWQGRRPDRPNPVAVDSPAISPVARHVVRRGFSDGSRVVLYPGGQCSELFREEVAGGNDSRPARLVRSVWLMGGRAEFDVAPADDPFMVSTPACNVEGTETCFEVNVLPADSNSKGEADMIGRRIRNLVTVAVLTGTVSVLNPHGQLTLAAGQQAVVQEGEAPAKANINALAAMFVQYYKPVTVEARPAVPAYDLPVDLSKVDNFDAVNAKLNLDRCKSLLGQNGFAVSPWEARGGGANDFQDAYKTVKTWELPVFVTSDSLLHLYHMQFDETLKNIEERVFAADMQALLETLATQLVADYGKASGELKTSLGVCLGQTAVALQLLSDTGSALGLLKQARADAGKINPGPMDWRASAKFSTEHRRALDVFHEIGQPLGVKGPWPGNQGWSQVLAAMDQILAHVENQSKAAAGIKLPEEIKSKVDAELKLISVHQGQELSPLFSYKEDYSQYVPRGHYTRSELLKRYFKSMMYLGRMTYLLKGKQDTPAGVTAIVDTADAKRQTVAAAHLTRLLTTGQTADGRKLADVWQRIYGVTAYYVGVADDLSFRDYADALGKVIGKDLDAAKLLDDMTFFRAKIQLAKLRGPAIYSGTGDVVLTTPKVLTGESSPEDLAKVLELTQGLRVMGQRFVPDSYVTGKLVLPTIGVWNGGKEQPWSLGMTLAGPRRCFPRGLDVMGVFGSQRAGALLKQVGDTAYAGYDTTVGQLRGEFDKLTAIDWNRNLYWSWIWSLNGLATPVEKGYPSFMQTTAWQDRQVHAACASWSQLRHDTILYAKQSYAMVGAGIPRRPKDVPGYVEPSVEFYARLLALARMTSAGLDAMKVLDDASRQRLASLDKIIEQLLDISTKELADKVLTAEQYAFIKLFGENLTGTLSGLDSKARDTRIVADMHTDGNTRQCVEEATGPLDWVVVVYRLPDGTLGMGIGPTLSYYEFKQPVADRLTDEAWQKWLSGERTNAAVRRPNWAGNFLASPATESR